MSRPTTLREALEAAYKEDDTPRQESPEPETAPEPSPVPEPEPAPEPAQEPQAAAQPESGQPEEQEEPPAERTEPPAEPPAESMEAGQPAPDAGEVIPPPNTWSMEALKTWDAIPPEARREIQRREQEITLGLEKTKEERTIGRQFQDVVARYQPVIAAEGVNDPIQGFEHLMQSVAALRMGSPQEKAQRMAMLIQNYGVPIKDLDEALAGIAPAQDPVVQAVQQQIEPIQQYIANQQQTAQQQISQQQQQIQEDLARIAGEEFFELVKSDLADLIDLAARRGETVSIKDAYDKACRINPKVAAIQAQRQQAEQARKQAAASSLPSQSAPEEEPDLENMDLRDQISAIWDAQRG